MSFISRWLTRRVINVVGQQMQMECQQNPTELNYQRMEAKQQVLQRLKSQLSTVNTPPAGDHLDVSHF